LGGWVGDTAGMRDWNWVRIPHRPARSLVLTTIPLLLEKSKICGKFLLAS